MKHQYTYSIHSNTGQPEEVPLILQRQRDIFSTEDAESIKEICRRDEWERNRTHQRETTFVYKTMETGWIYEKLEEKMFLAAEFFDFDVTGLEEPFRFIDYREGDNINTWHTDFGADGVGFYRKISASVDLSPTGSHNGGVDIFPDFVGENRIRTTQGTGLFWPGNTYHRVPPLEVGLRSILLAFGKGPPFR